MSYQEAPPFAYATLLETILGIPREESLIKWGFQVPVCQNCGKFIQKGRVFCSRKCQKEAHLVPIRCSYCGTQFLRRWSETKECLSRLNHPLRHGKGIQHVFCNKQCHGKWFAEHYGFGVFPEHAVLGGIKSRTLDWDKISQLNQEKGWGSYNIARALGYKKSSVAAILVKLRKQGLLPSRR